MSEQDQLHEGINRFIGVANEMKDSGVPIHVVSTAMMRAFCVYATYSVAGNTGGLTESGVEKMAEVFKEELAGVQAARKAEVDAVEPKEG
ncbi:MAG: DUF3144 domain-containing protein [Halioglobus sp.]